MDHRICIKIYCAFFTQSEHYRGARKTREHGRTNHFSHRFTDEPFGFGFIPAHEDFQSFAAAHEAERERVRVQKNELIKRDIDDVIHFSVVPWLKFTAIGHPRDRNISYSVPKIVIGKCHQQGSGWTLPVALSAHHGLVDGLHAARFFDRLQHRFDQAETLLAS